MGEKSTTEIVTEFEREVQKIFGMMGFKVEWNKLLNSRQIDLYGEKDNPPADIFKIAIECKDQKANVGSDDVDKFNAKIGPFLRDRSLDRGYIISRSDFAPAAKETARANGIDCLTYQELLRSMVNFDYYVEELITAFENSEVSKYYIELEGSRTAIGEGEIKCVEKHIKKWAKKGKANHISLLGEYGSGKTTICMKLAHDLAKEYKQDPIGNRIPILINLRNYSKAMNLKQLITDLLVNTHRIQGITNSIFMKMNVEGRFVLIFDGFDEMAQKVNVNITVKNFEELAQTATPVNSKVILTCRTEYFRSNAEEREILSSAEGKYIDLSTRPNFEIVHIKPFSLIKIKQFLQKVNYGESESILEKIKETYNLYELSQRPVLLDMIVKSIPQLNRMGGTINAGKLYEVYTDEWIHRDIASGRTILSKSEKNKMVVKVARQLYDEGRPHLHFSELPPLVKDEFDLDTRTEVDYYEHDFRTCSYLTRDDDGNYKFVHKSFMEYFIAKGVIEAALKNDHKPLFDFLSPEIVYFASDLSDEKMQSALWDMTESCRDMPEKDVGHKCSNAISILNHCGFPLDGIDLSNLQLGSCDLSNGSFVETNFAGSDLHGANFTNSILTSAILDKTNLADCMFGNIGRIQSIAFGPTDDRFIYATSRGHLKEIDILNDVETASCKAHEKALTVIQFSNDKVYLITVGRRHTGEGSVKLWKAYNLTLVKEATIEGTITALSYCPQNKCIAIGDSTGRIHILGFPELDIKKVSKKHEGAIISLEFGEGGDVLYSSGEDCVIGFWESPSLHHIDQWKKFKSPAMIHESKNRLYVVPHRTATETRLFTDVLSLSDGKFVKASHHKPKAGKIQPIVHKRIRAKDFLFAMNATESTVEMLDGEDLTLVRTIPTEFSQIQALDVSDDEGKLAIGNLAGSVSVLEIETGKNLVEISQNFSGRNLSIKGTIGLTPAACRFLVANGAVD